MLALEIVDFLGFQEGNEGLAKVLGDVLGVPEVVRVSFFGVPSLLLEDVNLLIVGFAVFVTVVGGNCVLGLSRQLLGVIVGLALRDAERVGILNGVNLVLVDNFSDFFHLVAVHLAEMVLDLKFGGDFFMDQGELKVVLVVPIYAVELELLLRQDALSQDALLAHHLKLVGRVHSD